MFTTDHKKIAFLMVAIGFAFASFAISQQVVQELEHHQCQKNLPPGHPLRSAPCIASGGPGCVPGIGYCPGPQGAPVQIVGFLSNNTELPYDQCIPDDPNDCLALATVHNCRTVNVFLDRDQWGTCLQLQCTQTFRAPDCKTVIRGGGGGGVGRP
jgi:hypothetical protein